MDFIVVDGTGVSSETKNIIIVENFPLLDGKK